MSRAKDAHIETLITAESIVFALVLIYLTGHGAAWDKNVTEFQFYSITIFLSIMLYVGCSFTLIRSIVLAFQSLHAEASAKRDDSYHLAYNLFLLVLFAVSIGVFASILSIIREAVFRSPVVPIQVVAPWWLFLALFLLLCVYIVIIVSRPDWISGVIDYLEKIWTRALA
jgi:hypothetical protein